MSWFTNITSVTELRNQYKKLLIRYHPDNNPNVDTTNIMQEINAEYDKLISCLKETDDSYPKDSSFSEDELKTVLKEVVKLKADITIEIVGSWIWIYGDTYSIKNQLKNLKFRWASRKKMWCWGTLTHQNNFSMDMEAIRTKYGSTVYRNRSTEDITTIGVG